MSKENLFAQANAVLTKLNQLCPWEAERRVEFLKEFESTVCAEKLPGQATKDQLFEFSGNWANALKEVYKDSPDIALINFLLKWLCELLLQGAGVRCGA